MADRGRGAARRPLGGLQRLLGGGRWSRNDSRRAAAGPVAPGRKKRAIVSRTFGTKVPLHLRVENRRRRTYLKRQQAQATRRKHA